MCSYHCASQGRSSRSYGESPNSRQPSTTRSVPASRIARNPTSAGAARRRRGGQRGAGREER
ncbi:hypothetical protein, partial [Streptomyces sp. SolWspMP-sol7th]|uniref:hypothetical protein n=1 Tax=Streptomyces sp. SolWspMP-sol7th TaxID=1839776 RepID=UPI001C312EE7